MLLNIRALGKCPSRSRAIRGRVRGRGTMHGRPTIPPVWSRRNRSRVLRAAGAQGLIKRGSALPLLEQGFAGPGRPTGVPRRLSNRPPRGAGPERGPKQFPKVDRSRGEPSEARGPRGLWRPAPLALRTASRTPAAPKRHSKSRTSPPSIRWGWCRAANKLCIGILIFPGVAMIMSRSSG